MCEFISAIKIKTESGHVSVLYLDDQIIGTKRTREILEGAKDNDLMGHHAIRLVYDLKQGQGEEVEVPDFWKSEKLPEELRPKLSDFATFKSNFGKLVTEHAQVDDLKYIIQNAPKSKKWQGLKAFCQEILTGRLLKNVTVIERETSIRYDLSVNGLVRENTFDGYVNDDVNDKNFPEAVGTAEKKTIKLVNIGVTASSEDIEFVLNHLNLRSADAKELLSLAKDHLDEQRAHPIVALKSVWQDPDGDRSVPYVSEWGGRRRLRLGWIDDGWNDCWWFAALSK